MAETLNSTVFVPYYRLGPEHLFPAAHNDCYDTYATQALALLLPQASARGLRYVELTTDPDNRPSQRVIEANGETLQERFEKSAAYGSKPALRYRIDLFDKEAGS